MNEAPKELRNSHSTPRSSQILSVALPVPIATLFDYLAPPLENYEGKNHKTAGLIGRCVLVPFGSRNLVGVICKQGDTSTTPTDKLKNITRLLDAKATLPKELLQLTQWLSNYYVHPIGECVLTAIPPYFRSENTLGEDQQWVLTTEGLGLPENALKKAKRQQQILQYLLEHKHCDADQMKQHDLSTTALKALAEKGLVKQQAKSAEKQPDSTHTQLLKEAALAPTEEQQAAISAIRFHDFSCSLLHGITGSGKTEVYLQLTARALQAGKQALVLIPEIGLSPQTVQRFKNRFNVKLAELHSNISDKVRAQHWAAAASNEARIVIGTRLAALTPMPELGLIIVDEEHDSSYKQQDSVRYSARDLSIYRAKTLNIPIMLGSATPSLETLNHALQKRYQHLVMKQRTGSSTRPQFQLIDLREQALSSGLAPQSIEAIGQTLAQGKQVLVFLNRRGYAPVITCHVCGWMSDCPRCSASMTLHSKPRRLHCHHCDLQRAVPKQCPSCQHSELDIQGLGTEQVEVALKQLFQNTQVVRVDRDSTKSKTAFKQALNTVDKGEPCILIGTQMLAKGHHFSNLKLVLVVDADQGFLNPDFRAMEKAGQLLMQVAGRAGREDDKGQVLIQTHRPEHPLLQTLISKGYTQFARHLLAERDVSNMPPYWHCAMIRAESKRGENAQQLLNTLVNTYRQSFPPNPAVSLIGPLPSAMEKVQDRFRFQLLLKAESRSTLKQILQTLNTSLQQLALAKRVRWSIDVDPVDTA